MSNTDRTRLTAEPIQPVDKLPLARFLEHSAPSMSPDETMTALLVSLSLKVRRRAS